MGHPRWLLDLIADDLHRTYSEPEFRYVYEKSLKLTAWGRLPVEEVRPEVTGIQNPPKDEADERR